MSIRYFRLLICCISFKMKQELKMQETSLNQASQIAEHMDMLKEHFKLIFEDFLSKYPRPD